MVPFIHCDSCLPSSQQTSVLELASVATVPSSEQTLCLVPVPLRSLCHGLLSHSKHQSCSRISGPSVLALSVLLSSFANTSGMQSKRMRKSTEICVNTYIWFQGVETNHFSKDFIKKPLCWFFFFFFIFFFIFLAL